ncbi:hypothetical protein KOEU_36040 [Komagataeibacter europaeus]|uniref:Uncharacterized protein n=2 Tax=Komagataeibacter europaeus TaxID=33995 RepID=A0A0M0ECC7_KOMEU|nr:hypothetical protein KOEU_36040 [Komagataeibacter europaeus]
MTRITRHIGRLATSILGTCFLSGTVLVSDAYADSDVVPRQFGHCMVGPAVTSDKIIVFCGASETEPSMVIGTMIDNDSEQKNLIPEITYFDVGIKNKEQILHFDFGPYHQVPGLVTKPPGAWFVNDGHLSRWPGVFQALMNTQTFSATGDSGTDTVDLTGFSQAFQYFTREYKRIHNQPFPGWH